MDYWIGLGSNSRDGREQVRRAVALLGQLPLTRLQRISKLYRSPPWGYADQPDFTNAVVHMRSDLEPMALLGHLQAIEIRLGRKRGGRRWGPRAVDLDILVANGLILHLEGLTVPHRYLHRRAFALVPLAELAPELLVPARGKVGSLLAHLPDHKVRPLSRQ